MGYSNLREPEQVVISWLDNFEDEPEQYKHRPYTSATANRLVKWGWLTKSYDADRMPHYRLTPEGRAAYEAWLHELVEFWIGKPADGASEE